MRSSNETLIRALRLLANDAAIFGVAQRIEELMDRIQRLEEAGNELAKWADRNTPATILNDWTAAKEAKP